MKEFFHLQSGKVEPSWIDRNGHMNVVYYMRIFDEGMDLMLKTTRISDLYTGDDRLTIVASRVNIIHRKELLCGESWKLSSAFSTITPRHITLVFRLTADNSIRAYCYILGVFFRVDRRTPTTITGDLLEKLRLFTIAELTDPFENNE